MDALGGWLGGAYLWVKAVHLIFVVYWMAGLFLLPRFLIYQHPVAPGSAEDAAWIERSTRLRRIILTPSLVVAWALGLALVAHLGAWSDGWMHAKFALVIGLSGYHGWLVATTRRFATGARPLSEKALRLLNEVPGVAIIAIVLLVIVKPF